MKALEYRMAHTAISTSTRDPFDANSVSNLQTRRFSSRPELDDFAHSFMPTNLSWHCRMWKRLPLGDVRAPLQVKLDVTYAVCHDTIVGMTNTRVCSIVFVSTKETTQLLI